MHGHLASQGEHAPAAILLAAGLGRRLGGVPKSALRIDGLSLFERLVDALRQSGLDDIGAVIGPYADRLLPLAQRCGVRVLRQGVPGAPLACSQRLAVQEHRARQTPRLRRDLLLLVADLPLLTDADIVPLLHAWRARLPAVQALVPVVDGGRGHVDRDAQDRRGAPRVLEEHLVEVPETEHDDHVFGDFGLDALVLAHHRCEIFGHRDNSSFGVRFKGRF